MVDIKKNIKAHGWTISEIASKLNVTQPSISSVVNGNPSLSKLQEIASVMGISVSELLAEPGQDSTASLCCPHCGKKINIQFS